MTFWGRMGPQWRGWNLTNEKKTTLKNASEMIYDVICMQAPWYMYFWLNIFSYFFVLLYRIYSITLPRYLVYDSIKLILSWLLLLKWAMWYMGLLQPLGLVLMCHQFKISLKTELLGRRFFLELHILTCSSS